MDLFSGLRVSRQISRLEPAVSFEMGINRTFFQSRFFPRGSVGLNVSLIEMERFRLGPAFSYSYSFLKVNKMVGSIHQWNEMYGGYALSWGKTWRFCHSAMTGLMNERFRSQITEKKEGVNTLGYYFSFGVAYAW